MTKCIALWIDHKEAHVLHIRPDHLDADAAESPPHVLYKPAKWSEGTKEHRSDAKQFFHDVVRSVQDAEELLVAGPSTTKLDFVRYVHKHERKLEPSIVRVDTVDGGANGQFAAYAKQYFQDRAR
jgi:stalled ribosome rescue protein Dom34